MGRQSFPKPAKKTTINVRDVPEDLHVNMRVLALKRKVGLGQLYAEAVKVFLEAEAKREAKG